MKKVLGVLVGFAVAVVFLGSVAQADDVVIDFAASPDVVVNVDPDSNDITLDLVNGSPQLASVVVKYVNNNSDGVSGCNLTGDGKQVTFPVNVSVVSGVAATLPPSVQFTDCDPQTQTISISASAVGVTEVSLGAATSVTSNKTDDLRTFDASAVAFTVTVVNSTQLGSLDAPEIANAYLGQRADNSDCKEVWGTNRNDSNWHGQLLSNVAKKWQGQTFTNATRHIVEDQVRLSCEFGDKAGARLDH